MLALYLLQSSIARFWTCLLCLHKRHAFHLICPFTHVTYQAHCMKDISPPSFRFYRGPSDPEYTLNHGKLAILELTD